MDEAKLAEIDERRARVLRDGTAAGALCMAADDVPALVAEVRRLTAALATARREGAEEMRERCDAALTARLVEALREVHERQYRGTGAERDVVGAVRYTIDEIRDEIRALPLDAPGRRA